MGRGFNVTSGNCEQCGAPQYNVEISQYAPCAYQECPEDMGISATNVWDASNSEWNETLDTNCVPCDAGFYSPIGSGQCSDINECADDTHTCDGNATCTNNIGNFTCACNYGFNGDGYDCALNQCEC